MDHLISLLTHYRYLVLFPLAIVEGPIISVIAGLLCALKVLDPFLVVPLIVSGDMIGDSVYYGLGRWQSTKLPPRILKHFIPGTDRLEKTRNYFEANPIRTLFLSKIILGIGFAGLYLAGNAKVPYKKFLIICLVTTLCQCAVYVIIGFLFGAAYNWIGSLLNGFATFTIGATLAAALVFFIKSKLKKL